MTAREQVWTCFSTTIKLPVYLFLFGAGAPILVGRDGFKPPPSDSLSDALFIKLTTEVLGSFVVLPRCSMISGQYPQAIHTITDLAIFHRRQRNLKTRCGLGLNPKQSKPLFTCSWPDSNRHGISPISPSN